MSKVVGVCAIATAILSQSTMLASADSNDAAFVIDANNGKVLYSESGDAQRYPASLTKMMTLYMLFEAMESGRVSKSTPMKVSSYAAARPPTKLRLKVGSTLKVEEAILSLVTLSANDASVVIAEHLAGSEARFAEQMTAKARQLGMRQTTFRNANGLPNPGQVTTARDMATLGIALREHFPREFAYFKTKSFNFRGRTINGHNRLVGRIQGVDGIKTGYINASGYNLVSSLLRDDKKIVGVVMGGSTGAARDKKMANLLTKYLAQASTRTGGPLIASRATEPRVTVAAAAPTFSYQPPSTVPLPRMRETINERIAEAYGADADAAHAIARIAAPARPIVGRAALRAALAAPRPARLAPVHSLAPSRPVPPGAIPGGGDYDPMTTGTILSRAASPQPTPWVIQIAAMPEKDRAMDMLAEAKARSGAALSDAQPFTEVVATGSQTLHRARFSGFQSKNEANQACAALKRHSYNCYTVAN
ncbi:D-alanyl-D-alanine carboxypeptidase [Aureimonas sp. SA4125]|uniref:D-alanyl-D-alanine carboxypeptidase n=1 Tax=Aureimonas sp. SA4125 TaxID=2826993 RepID=UPI001CC6564A|nr:D-alanyl-D-alanine carboxypeptidase [Aureimonas sp. SA4125]